jgi:hypothetical protein
MVSTDMLARRRQWLLVLAALGFLLWQLSRFALVLVPLDRAPLLVASLAGFLVFAAAFGATFFWAREARGNAALEDELTRHNRLLAMGAGFWAMLIAAALLLGVGQFFTLSGAEAGRLVMIVGVVAPLLRFAMLERAGEP